MNESITELRSRILNFIQQQKMPNGEIGEYRYSAAATEATLYSSAYAAMTRSLLNDLDSLDSTEREAWIAYFNRHQDEDGLYRDAVIYDRGWYAGDPLWCGRPHLTCHVITALTCLGGVAARPFHFLDRFLDADYLVGWLESRDWGERVGWSGNEIMNIGTLLQYCRDFHAEPKAARAVEVMLEWLSTHHIHPDTGVWGDVDTADAVWRSHAVQAAYHWWTLFFYDHYPIPYPERAIDTLLQTQNPIGGFGWGVHNAQAPYHSSACEDIDSIDPLARLSQVTPYRREEIWNALQKGADWVLKNHMPDGGFVFMLDCPFEYGHPQLHSEAKQGAMFPTWFRTLSLALIGMALRQYSPGYYPWKFIRCPGYQFWG